jgi:trehalose-phosphatase
MSAWPKVSGQIEKAASILLLIDFDGTLTPIVERPELAEIPKKTRVVLQELARLGRYTVGVISGRALDDLRRKIEVDGIIYAGNHGFEIEGPGLHYVNPIIDELEPVFEVVKRLLISTLGAIKGILIEDKGITLSIHYRQVDKAKVKEVNKLVESALDSITSRGLIKVTSGKKVYEIKPAVNWDKGKAIRFLMKKYGKGGRKSGLLPIYLGDDAADEDAFKIIKKYGQGITVHVGEPYLNSTANYFLWSPEEVFLFLSQLLNTAHPV